MEVSPFATRVKLNSIWVFFFLAMSRVLLLGALCGMYLKSYNNKYLFIRYEMNIPSHFEPFFYFSDKLYSLRVLEVNNGYQGNILKIIIVMNVLLTKL